MFQVVSRLPKTLGIVSEVAEALVTRRAQERSQLSLVPGRMHALKDSDSGPVNLRSVEKTRFGSLPGSPFALIRRIRIRIFTSPSPRPALLGAGGCTCRSCLCPYRGRPLSIAIRLPLLFQLHRPTRLAPLMILPATLYRSVTFLTFGKVRRGCGRLAHSQGSVLVRGQGDGAENTAWPRSMSTPILSRDLEYGTDTDRRTSFRGELNDG